LTDPAALVNFGVCAIRGTQGRLNRRSVGRRSPGANRRVVFVCSANERAFSESVEDPISADLQIASTLHGAGCFWSILSGKAPFGWSACRFEFVFMLAKLVVTWRRS
jgi:hypothetical protein